MAKTSILLLLLLMGCHYLQPDLQGHWGYDSGHPIEWTTTYCISHLSFDNDSLYFIDTDHVEYRGFYHRNKSTVKLGNRGMKTVLSNDSTLLLVATQSGKKLLI